MDCLLTSSQSLPAPSTMQPAFVLCECGPDRRGADLQEFGNFGGVNVVYGRFNGSQLVRADMFKSTYISPIDADTDDKDPLEKQNDWQTRPEKINALKQSNGQFEKVYNNISEIKLTTCASHSMSSTTAAATWTSAPI